MEGRVLDGGAGAITAALQRNRAKIEQLIASRRDGQTFRDGLHDGVQHYCATTALHDLQLATLKRDYARGTREHVREVHRFLSSPESEDEFALRSMLNFVLGLLACYVEMTEDQAEIHAARALSNLDPHDLTHA